MLRETDKRVASLWFSTDARDALMSRSGVTLAICQRELGAPGAPLSGGTGTRLRQTPGISDALFAAAAAHCRVSESEPTARQLLLP